jgi:hypothetical protein
VFACLDPQYRDVSTLITVPASTLSSSLDSGLYNFVDVPVNTYISQYVFAMALNSYWIQVGWISLILVVIRVGATLSFQLISWNKR